MRIAEIFPSARPHLADAVAQLDIDLSVPQGARMLELTELARLINIFAQLLTPADGNDQRLTAWIADARAADLPHLHGRAGFDLLRHRILLP